MLLNINKPMQFII